MLKLFRKKEPVYFDLDSFDFSSFAREVTEEELYLINGGAMSDADQAAMAEACKSGNAEKQAEIRAKYETKDGASTATSTGTKTIATSASTATSTVATTQAETVTQPTVSSEQRQYEMAKKDVEKKTGTSSSSTSSYSSGGYSGQGGSASSSGSSSKSSSGSKSYVSALTDREQYEMGIKGAEERKSASNSKLQDNSDVIVPKKYASSNSSSVSNEFAGHQSIAKNIGETDSKREKGSFFFEKFINKVTHFIAPNGFGFFNTQSNNAASIFRSEPKTKDLYKKETSDKPLFQAGIGKRKALGLGYSASVGVVWNRNNHWDSGIMLSAGGGFGVEESFNLTKSAKLNHVIDATRSTVDFTEPTSTADIEGFSKTAYVTAGMGISFDLDKEVVKGVQLGSIGGGVYYELTNVITVGEVAEGAYNTGPFIMNQIFDYSGLGRLMHCDYIELDGKR